MLRVALAIVGYLAEFAFLAWVLFFLPPNERRDDDDHDDHDDHAEGLLLAA